MFKGIRKAQTSSDFENIFVESISEVIEDRIKVEKVTE